MLRSRCIPQDGSVSLTLWLVFVILKSLRSVAFGRLHPSVRWRHASVFRLPAPRRSNGSFSALHHAIRSGFSGSLPRGVRVGGKIIFEKVVWEN